MQCIHSGIDWLTFTTPNLLCSTRITDLTKGLSSTCNGYGTIMLANIPFNIEVASDFPRLLVFIRNDNYPLMRLVQLTSAQKRFRRLDESQIFFSVDIFGAFFAHSHYLPLLHTLAREHFPIQRLDFCLDFPCTPSFFVHNIVTKVIRKKSCEFKSSEGALETIYYGAKTKKQNTNYLIRIYNKKIDTLKKQKIDLFPWVLEHEAITRLEIEMRAQQCRTLDTSVLTSPASFLARLESILHSQTLDIDVTLSPNKIPLYTKETAHATTKYYLEKLTKTLNTAKNNGADIFIIKKILLDNLTRL